MYKLVVQVYKKNQSTLTSHYDDLTCFLSIFGLSLALDSAWSVTLPSGICSVESWDSCGSDSGLPELLGLAAFSDSTAVLPSEGGEGRGSGYREREKDRYY